MSEKTNIEWATSTGNPWVGCTKVSPGCKNCYAAELDANRFSRSMGQGTPAKPESHWGPGAPRVRTKTFWKDALKWDRGPFRCGTCGERFQQLSGRQKLCEPIPGDSCSQCNNGRYERPRIFPSLCDIWDPEVPLELLAEFLILVAHTGNLDWLLLTKRPEHCLSRIEAVLDLPSKVIGSPTGLMLAAWMDGRPPENVWIGVSVEDQQRADERIPLLLKIPAKIRFLSVEPLLSEIIFHRNLTTYTIELLDWAIVGAESGKDRRDCGIAALESAASQFVRAKVPCFVKQDCAFKPGQKGRIADDIWALKQFPNLLAR